VVFKRRDKLSIFKSMTRFFWPQGGWKRSARYMRLRVNRLPDPPHRISRGIALGVFTVFTPFYGLHFVLAYWLARAFNGNAFAALLGTIAGNPFTYIPIGVVSLKIGHALLGTEFDHENQRSFVGKSYDALAGIFHNITSLFSGREAEWADIGLFAREIGWPYLVGGILPGVTAAVAAYYLTLPMITAYQSRRRKAREKS